jgi:hypothetical protein
VVHAGLPDGIVRDMQDWLQTLHAILQNLQPHRPNHDEKRNPTLRGRALLRALGFQEHELPDIG